MFAAESRQHYLDTNQDASRLLKVQRHRQFFNVCFDFSLVTIVDPMDVEKSRSQVQKDADKVIAFSPTQESLLKAAEKQLRACGLLDFAHCLSALAKSPVDLAKKVRRFIDEDIDKPAPKSVEPEDALRLVFSASLSVEAYRVNMLSNPFFIFTGVRRVLAWH